MIIGKIEEGALNPNNIMLQTAMPAELTRNPVTVARMINGILDQTFDSEFEIDVGFILHGLDSKDAIGKRACRPTIGSQTHLIGSDSCRREVERFGA
jgi:hypothetical protein